jgi:hypothetical protein
MVLFKRLAKLIKVLSVILRRDRASNLYGQIFNDLDFCVHLIDLFAGRAGVPRFLAPLFVFVVKSIDSVTLFVGLLGLRTVFELNQIKSNQNEVCVNLQVIGDLHFAFMHNRIVGQSGKAAEAA